MIQISIEPTVEEKAWNESICSSPSGTIFQTTYWAEFYEERMKVKPYFLTAFNGRGDILGQLLFFNEPIGFQSVFLQHPMRRFALPFMRRMFPSLQWRFGPLIHHPDPIDRIDIANAILKELDLFAEKLRGVSIEPSTPPIHGCFSDELTAAYSEGGFSTKSWATFLIDLTSKEDILLKNLDRSARKSIRKTQKQMVVVSRADSLEDLKEFCQLGTENAKAGEWGFSFGNFSVIWNMLRRWEAVEVFLARQEERLLGGLGILRFNGILTEFGVVRSAYATEKKIYEGDLIKWEIMKWGHQEGCRIYDLAGVDPAPPAQSKAEGIRRFKEKWGGRLVVYPLFHKAYAGIKQNLFQHSLNLVKKIRAN
jgi:hypothetical protein